MVQSRARGPASRFGGEKSDCGLSLFFSFLFFRWNYAVSGTRLVGRYGLGGRVPCRIGMRRGVMSIYIPVVL